MKIAITGVAGFVGSNLSERLVQRGDTVRGIDPPMACQLMKRFQRWDLTRTLVLVDGRIEGAEGAARTAGATDVETFPLNVHSFAQKIRRLLG